MNYKQANLEICREIINNGIVRGQNAQDEYFLAIPGPHAFYGYFFPKKDIAFSLPKVDILTQQIVDFSIVTDENRIAATDILRITGFNKMARRFKAKGWETWVDARFLKNIDMGFALFYQEKENGMIIVEENEKPVMVMLPILIRD